jgi:hypothetical protein
MNRVLLSVEDQLSHDPGFGGIAIHSWLSYSEMAQ